ncbi:MAG TPA: ribonuclease P protein component [Eggerthellaceae bacterium]|nr:ribonuclease P protein component [Eggerthellaceae bacterium]
MKTIRSSSEISELFDRGRRVHTPHLNLIILRHEKQHDHDGRVAFIAGKKLGNAVWRNRAKRRMRALCRDVGGPFDGFDVAFIARRDMDSAPWKDIRSDLANALRKAGVGRG